MKPILLTALAVSTLAVSSFGATISAKCGTNTYSAAGSLDTSVRGDSNTSLVPASATIDCPSFNVAGADLTSVILYYVVDYSFAQLNPIPVSVSMNFDPSGTNIFTNDIPLNVSKTGTGSTSNAQSSPNTSTFIGDPGTTTFIGPSVVLTPGTFTGADTVSASVFIDYIYDIPQTGEVPEPTSVALLGAGLVGLGVVARRKR